MPPALEAVARNAADGIRICEFPVVMEAARAARAQGMAVIAGAPNIVRGGSHSGNLAAADLVREGAVDALASDYVPASLVEAAWRCMAETGMSLPDAVAMITEAPARMVRLEDRGRILPGLRAHLGGAAARPRRVASICLFTQSGPDAPFLLARRLPLRAGR